MSHTKGPWEIFQDKDGTNVIYCNGDTIQRHICYTSEGGVSDKETEANAYLIAAAPDMLNALKIAILWSDEAWVGHEIVTKAIAKATQS